MTIGILQRENQIGLQMGLILVRLTHLSCPFVVSVMARCRADVLGCAPCEMVGHSQTILVQCVTQQLVDT